MFLGVLVATSPRRAPLAAAVTILLVMTESVGVLMLVPLLQLVGIDAQQGSLGRIGEAFRAVFQTFHLEPTLPLVLLGYLGLATAQSALQRWHSVLSAAVQFDVVSALRETLYRAVASARWVFLARRRASDFVHLLVTEVDRVGTATSYLLDLSASVLVSAAYLAVAVGISPAATACVLVTTGVFAWILRGRLDRAHRLGGESTQARRELHAAIAEYFGGMKTAKSYDNEDRHVEAFVRLSRRVRDVALSTIGGYAQMRQATATGTALVLVLVVYVGVEIVRLSPAHLLVLLFVFARLMPRLNGLLEGAQVFVSMLPALAAIENLRASCEAEREPQGTGSSPVQFSRDIQLDRVSFSYRADGSGMLQDVTLTIPAGSLTALVGPSGAGKTTLADLLLGLIVPDQGVVRIDGVPLDGTRLKAWRALVGYVTQDTFLYHASVRENLHWSRPLASDDDIWLALERAAAADFVRALPDGLNTVVGDRGALISGGERQRLSLARALLRRPRLLILDEATGALDAENEGRILEALNALRGTITIVLITHRLALTRAADMIHVIEDGRMVESGAWHTLQQRQGRFLSLLEGQGARRSLDQEPLVVNR